MDLIKIKLADSLSFSANFTKGICFYISHFMIQALTLLTMALQLLIAANQPNVPNSIKQTAITVANTAIKVAQQVLKEPVTISSKVEIITEPLKISQSVIPKIEVQIHSFEVIPIKTSNTIETNQIGEQSSIPNVYLGTFKIRTNSNMDIRWYDCNVTTSDSWAIFSSYKLKGFMGEADNNCFINTGIVKTDSEGFTSEIELYLNDLRPFVGNPYSRKIRFYLNDITIQEVTTGLFHRATSSLPFDLEITRY